MNNKQKIKDVFDTKINKDNIYNNIIKKEKIIYMNILKISLAPICIILIVMFVSISLPNKTKQEDIKEKGNSGEINKEDIKDNNSEKLSNEFADILGICENFNISELIKEEPLLAKIEFPEDVKEERCLKNYKVADLSDRVVIYKDSNNRMQRGDFIGYELMFGNDSKDIDIFVSKTLDYKLRCTMINLNEFSVYNILGIEFKMMRYSNKYIILFKCNDYYWDIETYNLTDQEVIDLIKSIIL